MVFTFKFYVVLGSTVFSLHINIWFWVILDLQSHLNILSLRNIVSVEIVQEMRLAIFGIDQLRKISFLIFLKRICHWGSLFTYFHFGTTYPEKNSFFLCGKKIC